MSEMLEDISYLSREIGPRPAGTEEEQQAALYIADQMQKRTGFSTAIEDFNCAPAADVIEPVCFGLPVLFGLLAMFRSGFAVPALLVTLACAVIYLLEVFDHPVLSRFFERGVSQNVVARYTPGSKSGSYARKVVIVANYDSGKVRRELSGIWPAVRKGSTAALIALAIIWLLRVVFQINPSGTVAMVLNVLTIVSIILAVIPVITFVMRRTANYNEAANHNASGVAVMMEVASRIANGMLSEEELQARAQAESGEGEQVGTTDAAIHGEQAARAAGVVPAEATMSYEVEPNQADAAAEEAPEEPVDKQADRLAQAKAAVAALTGRPVREYQPISESFDTGYTTDEPAFDMEMYAPGGTYATQGFDGDEPVDQVEDAHTEKLPIITTNNEAAYGEDVVEDDVFDEEVGDVPVPGVTNFAQDSRGNTDSFGYRIDTPSNVPDWYRRAQENARRDNSMNAQPARRSRFADAPAVSLETAQPKSEPAVFVDHEDRLKSLQDIIEEGAARAQEQIAEEAAADEAAFEAALAAEVAAEAEAAREVLDEVEEVQPSFQPVIIRHTDLESTPTETVEPEVEDTAESEAEVAAEPGTATGLEATARIDIEAVPEPEEKIESTPTPEAEGVSEQETAAELEVEPETEAAEKPIASFDSWSHQNPVQASDEPATETPVADQWTGAASDETSSEADANQDDMNAFYADTDEPEPQSKGLFSGFFSGLKDKADQFMASHEVVQDDDDDYDDEYDDDYEEDTFEDEDEGVFDEEGYESEDTDDEYPEDVDEDIDEISEGTVYEEFPEEYDEDESDEDDTYDEYEEAYEDEYQEEYEEDDDELLDDDIDDDFEDEDADYRTVLSDGWLRFKEAVTGGRQHEAAYEDDGVFEADEDETSYEQLSFDDSYDEEAVDEATDDDELVEEEAAAEEVYDEETNDEEIVDEDVYDEEYDEEYDDSEYTQEYEAVQPERPSIFGSLRTFADSVRDSFMDRTQRDEDFEPTSFEEAYGYNELDEEADDQADEYSDEPQFEHHEDSHVLTADELPELEPISGLTDDAEPEPEPEPELEPEAKPESERDDENAPDLTTAMAPIDVSALRESLTGEETTPMPEVKEYVKPNHPLPVVPEIDARAQQREDSRIGEYVSVINRGNHQAYGETAPAPVEDDITSVEADLTIENEPELEVEELPEFDPEEKLDEPVRAEDEELSEDDTEAKAEEASEEAAEEDNASDEDFAPEAREVKKPTMRKPGMVALPEISDGLDTPEFQQPAPLADVVRETPMRDRLVSGSIPRVSVDGADQGTGRREALRQNIPSLSGAFGGVSASDDVDETSNETVSKTGSFAPIGNTGAFAPIGDELVEGLDEEDIYIDDADDSHYEQDVTETGAYAGPQSMYMPKSRGGRLFDRFRKRDHSATEGSAASWLGVSEDFDPRTVGKEREGWESFQEGSEYSKRTQGQMEGDETDIDTDIDIDVDTTTDDEWNGGAYSADQAQGSADVSDAARVAEEVRMVYNFRNPDVNTEVWFVALGSEQASNGGTRAFLREHAQELRGAILVNLESMGGGQLSYVGKEGQLQTRKPSSRLRRYLKKAAEATGIVPADANLDWRESITSIALRRNMQGMTLVGMDGVIPAGMNRGDDVVENIDPDVLEQNVEFVLNIIKNV